MARSGLSHCEALEIVQTAIDVQSEITDDRGENVSVGSRSVQLLEAIAANFRTDAPQKDSFDLNAGASHGDGNALA